MQQIGMRQTSVCRKWGGGHRTGRTERDRAGLAGHPKLAGIQAVTAGGRKLERGLKLCPLPDLIPDVVRGMALATN